jgi:hypothetical protein
MGAVSTPVLAGVACAGGLGGGAFHGINALGVGGGVVVESCGGVVYTYVLYRCEGGPGAGVLLTAAKLCGCGTKPRSFNGSRRPWKGSTVTGLF